MTATKSFKEAPMSVSVLIPTALRAYAGGNDSIQVEGQTVDEALVALTNDHPALKKHLYNNEGQLRQFVNIYVNDEDIRYAGNGAMGVKEGDTISIVPSIAGGSTLVEEAAKAVELDRDEVLRYSRHLIMPEVAL